MPRPSLSRLLHSGWFLRAADPARAITEQFDSPEGWMPATVPGTVYQDLLAHGRIPDPYIARHEADVQWVAECDWIWRLDFEVDARDGADSQTPWAGTDLCLDGLDTVAQVWLDGVCIAHSDNMFVPLRLPLQLAAGRHRLVLHCASALRHGRALRERLGDRPLWNGDSSRLYVRKAAYHYGWDWGPALLTAGPWQPVRLEHYDLRIAGWHTPTWVSEDGQRARIDLHVALAGQIEAVAQPGLAIEHRLLDPDGREVACRREALRAQHHAWLDVDAPRLWWPSGHGPAALYTLRTRLLHGEAVIESRERRIGLRRVRLLQQPVAGEPGSSFHFEVNGRELFVGGANWIPDDLLLNRITPARYRERVQQAVEGGHTMLRVWGGGIYEDEAFYDACDELGVMVWQDFAFACGLYPAHDDFVRSVEAEARAAIERLRHRASLVIWCGNNEDYTLAETFGAHGSGKDGWRFAARRLYEERLPTLCAALDPDRPYWPGSPYTPGGDGLRASQDPTMGDRHSWEVWHQLMLPYQRYGELCARFVSEFGMQSHPSMAVLRQALPDPAEQRPGSRTLQWHNKAFSPVGPDGHRRLAVYLADNLPPVATLDAEVQATQFVQAEALRHAYEAFRRRWQRPGARACGGALVWQLNDCWPVSSWALIDSGGHRKPAWYAVRRALAPLACALRLPDGANPRAQAWVMSSLMQDTSATLTWTLQAFDGRTIDRCETRVTVLANGTTELAPPATWSAVHQQPVVGFAQLRAEGHAVRASAWQEPHRWYPVQDPAIEWRASAQGLVSLRATRPAKGVWIDGEGLQWSDNFIDLPADETIELGCTGPLADTPPDRWRLRSLFNLQGTAPVAR